MTLLYPSRPINMAVPSTCFSNSTPFKIPYVSKTHEKERVEANHQLAFNAYEELAFRLEGLTTNNTSPIHKTHIPESTNVSSEPPLQRTTKTVQRSTSCREFKHLRSILKKSKKSNKSEKSKSVDYLNEEMKANLINLFNTGSDDDDDDCDEWSETCDDETRSCGSKNVTFADDKNGRLVEIRTFGPNLLTDILSKSPELTACLFFKAKEFRQKSTTQSPLVNSGCWHELTLCFKEPASEPDFHKKLLSQHVHLEKCGIRNRLITGLVLVRNVGYEKNVIIRYTTDRWKTNSDTDAIYLSNFEIGSIDRFTFTLNLPARCTELEFAICYKTPTCEYWDNNGGENYGVKNCASQLPA